MLRHIAIGLAVAVITCASAANVSAHGGGHGGGGHMGSGHFAAAHAGNFGSFSRSNFSGFSHPVVFHGNHAAFANHFAGHGFRHRFHRRFFFVGSPYVYAYDDDCYVRIWTRWGWRWRNVCY